jgi:hypothetical protein
MVNQTDATQTQDAALFRIATAAAKQAVERAGHLLDVIELSPAPLDLLTARLAPDMINCAGQLRTTAGFALRSTYPLTGKTAPVAAFSDDLRGLRACLTFTGSQVAGLTVHDFAGTSERLISHRAGEAELVQDAPTYLNLFALPNLWFHLSMAYAILRSRGLPVGKADFDGWHGYSR